MKLDDLLEMQRDNRDELELEYVQFSVAKVINLLNKKFTRRQKW